MEIFDRKAVLWDLDGTLVDSEPVHKDSIVILAHDLGIELPANIHSLLLGKGDVETHQWMQEERGVQLTLEEWSARREAIYLENMRDVKPFPETLALWNAFAENNIPQAIVSNSSRAIVDVNMRLLGESASELISVSADDVMRPKPFPDPYLRAAEIMGVDPKDAIAIEDSATGARAAMAAGLKVYVVPWYEGDRREVFELKDLLV